MQPVLSFTIVAAAGVAALAAPRWRPPARLLAPLGDPGLLIPLALGALLGPVLHVVDASALRILAPVAVITAGWAGATAGARGEWAALARSPLGQLVVAVARWTALAVVTTAIVWLAVRRLAPLGGLWVPLATAAGTLAAATAGDRRDNATTAERGMAAGMSVVAVALIAVFFHPRQNVGGTSVGWHYWLVMTLADLGLLVLAAGVGAATTVSPFVVCGLAAGAAVSAAPDSPLRATLAAHAPVWRSILALCAGLWLGVPSVWLLAPAAGIALLRLAVPVGAFDIVALGVGLNAALLGPGGGAILGTVALALTLSLASRRGPVEVEA